MTDNFQPAADVPLIEQPDPTWQYPTVGALLALGERLEVELAPDETISVAADGLVGSLNSPHSTTDDRVRVGDVVLSVLDGPDGDSSDAADGTQAARQLQSLQFVDAAARERLRLQVLRPTQAAHDMPLILMSARPAAASGLSPSAGISCMSSASLPLCSASLSSFAALMVAAAGAQQKFDAQQASTPPKCAFYSSRSRRLWSRTAVAAAERNWKNEVAPGRL